MNNPTNEPVSDEVDELIERLHELAHAVTLGEKGIEREFTMRVPAEPKRDADLVLSKAADTLAAQKKEIEELKQKLKLPDDVYKAFDKGRNWDMYCRRQYKVDPAEETNIKILQERLEEALKENK